MRLIDADALELEGWYLSRNYRVDSRTMCFETKDIKKVPTAQPEKRTEERTETHACDCINRQAAIDGFYEMASDTDHLCTVSDYVHFLETMTSAQPEIIRCKDCKHSEHWYRDKCRCFLWVEDGIDVFDDGFCNYAERREE